MDRRLEEESARLRSSLRFVVAGLAVEVACIWNFRPATFVVLVLVAIPLVLVGVGVFVRAVWKVLRETDAL